MPDTASPHTSPETTPDPPADAIWFRAFNEIGILAQLSRAMFEARLTDGLLLPQFAVLNHLVRVGDGRTPLDLARAFQVPKTSMTHTVAMLADRGLVQVVPNPRDGRSKCVWITPAGRDWRTAAIGRLAPDIARLDAIFPAARVAAILPVLADLRAVLDRLREDG